MPARRDVTPHDIAAGRAAVEAQLDAFDDIAMVITDDETLRAFARGYFNDLATALDRRFVHRTPDASTPLGELRLVVDSLLHDNGVLRAGPDYDPQQSVLGMKIGDRIRLTRDDYERLSTAVFAELEATFR